MLTETSDILKRFQQTANTQHCPECGSLMTLVDWRNESEMLFVWYSCSMKECDGKWLRKIDIFSSNTEKVA